MFFSESTLSKSLPCKVQNGRQPRSGSLSNEMALKMEAIFVILHAASPFSYFTTHLNCTTLQHACWQLLIK